MSQESLDPQIRPKLPKNHLSRTKETVISLNQAVSHRWDLGSDRNLVSYKVRWSFWYASQTRIPKFWVLSGMPTLKNEDLEKAAT